MRKLSRGHFMATSAAAGAGVAAGASSPFFIGGGRRPPNVLLVVADAMRADHFAMRLKGASLTPNLERLAEDAHVFTNCRSPGSWTKLSTATKSWPNHTGCARSPRPSPGREHSWRRMRRS